MTQTAAPSIAAIRDFFPALRRRYKGQPVAHFDGPGGTQIASPALDAMTDYACLHNANTHWVFPTSAETDEIVAEARELAAIFFNTAAANVVFGPNMTALTFAVTNAMRSRIGPGDEILLTELDHHANIDPWKRLAAETGAAVQSARLIPETGQLDYGDLLGKIGPRTRVLAIGAASNAIGTINDVRRAVAAARAVGAYSYVDAVHYAPHELVDVQDWDADFVVCSVYKFYGPHVGLLFARPEHLAALNPQQLAPKGSGNPERWEMGTPNLEGIAGVGGTIAFLASLGRGATTREQLASAYRDARLKNHRQMTYLLEEFERLPGLRIFGPRAVDARTPTLGCIVRGRTSRELSAQLAERAVFASHGDCFATTAANILGTPDGWLRLGCAIYTSDDEVERAASALGDILR